MLKIFEGFVKLERIVVEVNGRNDVLILCKEEGFKEEGFKEISFDSIFSEIFNVDSFCIMDSGLFFLLFDSMSIFLYVCIEMVDFNIIYMSD